MGCYREGEDAHRESNVDSKDGEKGEESEEGDEVVAEDGVESDDEDDDTNSNMARSDILIYPPNTDKEEEVASQSKYVTKSSEYQMADMGNPEFVVG
jgi:hypothetical protein